MCVSFVSITYIPTLSDLNPLLSATLSKRGFSEPPTKSLILCPKNFKVGGVLSLSLLELLKPLLYGNHDNYSITECLFTNYRKNVVKNIQLQMLPEIIIFNLMRLRSEEKIQNLEAKKSALL